MLARRASQGERALACPAARGERTPLACSGRCATFSVHSKENRDEDTSYRHGRGRIGRGYDRARRAAEFHYRQVDGDHFESDADPEARRFLDEPDALELEPDFDEPDTLERDEHHGD